MRSVLLFLFAGLPVAAPAMVIDCGPTLCFEYDETQAAVAQFGLPVRVGDTMQFTPASFLLVAQSGATAPDLSASFVFERVFSPYGGEILTLRVEEEGDYEIVGSGAVSSRLELMAQSNFAAEEVVAAAVFGDSGDSGGAQFWNADAAVSPSAAFAGAASDLRLTLTNLLQASTTEFSDLAWLQKKFVVASTEVGAPVPLPGAVWLFATAAGCCGRFLKRRRSP